MISLMIFGFIMFAFVTSPIWLTILFFNIPLIALFGFLFFYTNLFNPLIKLFWWASMSLFTLWYPSDDMTLQNVGYASMNDKEGLFLEGVKDVFDKYRL